MPDVEKVINLLSKYKSCSFGDKDEKVTVDEIIAMLKEYDEALKLIYCDGHNDERCFE